MDKINLEKFRQAIAFAQAGRREEAHNILTDLQKTNPADVNVNALKSPSTRFDEVHATLKNAYSQFGTISSFALDSLTQNKAASNAVEVLKRLDEGRKQLEQGKADLKTLSQNYSKSR